MAMFDSAIDEARQLLHGIKNDLGKQTALLEKMANKPPKVSAKLVPVSIPEIRPFNNEPNKLKGIAGTGPGNYIKINHWAIILNAPTYAELWMGPTGKDGMNFNETFNDASLTPIDVNNSNANSSMNPNELIIPPNMKIYVFSTEGGHGSISYIKYELSL